MSRCKTFKLPPWWRCDRFHSLYLYGAIKISLHYIHIIKGVYQIISGKVVFIKIN